MQVMQACFIFPGVLSLSWMVDSRKNTELLIISMDRKAFAYDPPLMRLYENKCGSSARNDSCLLCLEIFWPPASVLTAQSSLYHSSVNGLLSIL